MYILTIDTSADETSVAIMYDTNVVTHVQHSQIKTHTQWGGIVPSLAKYAHEERIDPLITRALKLARISEKELDAVAVTVGPGLAVALEIGITHGRDVAKRNKIPFIAVNHMEGHLLSPFVRNSAGNPDRHMTFPFLSFLISGGHTELVLADRVGSYRVIGKTVDDAAGEALDKAARMLGLGYPGGPVIEQLAQTVNNVDMYRFPRPMIHDGTLNMSFSGLKTHFYYLLNGRKDQTVDIARDLAPLASSFQAAVFDCIRIKLEKALEQHKVPLIAIGGGVAANTRLRSILRAVAKKHNKTLYFPPYRYLCGDNAAMIGFAAYHKAMRGEYVEDADSLIRIPRLALG